MELSIALCSFLMQDIVTNSDAMHVRWEAFTPDLGDAAGATASNQAVDRAEEACNLKLVMDQAKLQTAQAEASMASALAYNTIRN